MNEAISWIICYLHNSASLSWMVYSKIHRETLGLEVPPCLYKYLILFFDNIHHADEALYDYQLFIKNILFARYYYRYWGYSGICEQDKDHCFQECFFPG